jgi:hypothetical protein
MWNLDEVRRGHERFLAETERLIGDAEEVAGRHAEEQVRANPPFKPRTGNLQRQTTHRVVRLGSGRILRIANSAKYAAAIDGGSRPHLIRARNGYLAFKGRDGKTVFRRQVQHPGNRPYKFLYRATNSAFRVLGHEIERRMSDAAKRF